MATKAHVGLPSLRKGIYGVGFVSVCVCVCVCVQVVMLPVTWQKH